MAVIAVLHDSRMFGQIFQYVTGFAEPREDALAWSYDTLLKQIFEFMVEKRDSAATLLSYPWTPREERVLESYLDEGGRWELLLFFSIQRRRDRTALEIYRKMALDQSHPLVSPYRHTANRAFSSLSSWADT